MRDLITELADELAISKTFEALLHLPFVEVASKDDLYQEDKNGDFILTEEAQDVYNQKYDYYINKLESLNKNKI